LRDRKKKTPNNKNNKKNGGKYDGRGSRAVCENRKVSLLRILFWAIAVRKCFWKKNDGFHDKKGGKGFRGNARKRQEEKRCRRKGQKQRHQVLLDGILVGRDEIKNLEMERGKGIQEGEQGAIIAPAEIYLAVTKSRSETGKIEQKKKGVMGGGEGRKGCLERKPRTDGEKNGCFSWGRGRWVP